MHPHRCQPVQSASRSLRASFLTAALAVLLTPAAPGDTVLVNAFGITDTTIGVVVGGQVYAFPLPAGSLPVTACGIAACAGQYVSFTLCVETTAPSIECVLGGAQASFPLPAPTVAPPLSWSTGGVNGVVVLTALAAYSITGGGMTTLGFPGTFTGYAIVPGGVAVTTTGGPYFIPLLGAAVVPFTPCYPAPGQIAFNIAPCAPLIAAVNAGWPPSGIQGNAIVGATNFVLGGPFGPYAPLGTPGTCAAVNHVPPAVAPYGVGPVHTELAPALFGLDVVGTCFPLIGAAMGTVVVDVVAPSFSIADTVTFTTAPGVGVLEFGTMGAYPLPGTAIGAGGADVKVMKKLVNGGGGGGGGGGNPPWIDDKYGKAYAYAHTELGTPDRDPPQQGQWNEALLWKGGCPGDNLFLAAEAYANALSAGGGDEAEAEASISVAYDPIRRRLDPIVVITPPRHLLIHHLGHRSIARADARDPIVFQNWDTTEDIELVFGLPAGLELLMTTSLHPASKAEIAFTAMSSLPGLAELYSMTLTATTDGVACQLGVQFTSHPALGLNDAAIAAAIHAAMPYDGSRGAFGVTADTALVDTALDVPHGAVEFAISNAAKYEGVAYEPGYTGPMPPAYPSVGPCDSGPDSDGDGARDACDDCPSNPLLTAPATLFTDADGDGYGAGAGFLTCNSIGLATNGLDCDDSLASAHPGAQELCNMIDDDCDGLVDENPQQIWHLDADGDGYGDAASALPSCYPPFGWVLDGTDCDDSDPTVHPGALELCNGRDDDCDGATDEGYDADGDGIADCVDVCPFVSDPFQGDIDGDGVGDFCDNCFNVPNPSQADCDGNTLGDACEGQPDCNTNGVPDNCDVASGSSLDANGNGVPDECEVNPIASFCAGDGTLADHATDCPCANHGMLGNGCANSANPSGANLASTGATTLDTVVLWGSGMPAVSSCIYLQGDGLSDLVFGDGVRCTGGSLLRLRTRTNVGGASSFPDSSDTISLSLRGGVAVGSGARRYYQTYYRNASPAFCPPATFNVTNGIRIDW